MFSNKSLSLKMLRKGLGVLFLAKNFSFVLSKVIGMHQASTLIVH